MRRHHLKILPIYFDAVQDGVKTAEVRYNDRGFMAGDWLALEEWDGEEYTGRVVERRITAVFGLAKIGFDGYVLICMK